MSLATALYAWLGMLFFLGAVAELRARLGLARHGGAEIIGLLVPLISLAVLAAVVAIEDDLILAGQLVLLGLAVAVISTGMYVVGLRLLTGKSVREVWRQRDQAARVWREQRETQIR